MRVPAAQRGGDRLVRRERRAVGQGRRLRRAGPGLAVRGPNRRLVLQRGRPSRGAGLPDAQGAGRRGPSLGATVAPSPFLIDPPGGSAIFWKDGSEDTTMSKAVKIALTVVVLGLALTGLLRATLREGTEYYKHVDEVMVNPEAWHGQAAAAARLRRTGFDPPQARLARVPVQGDPQGRRHAHVVAAQYTGIVPDTFGDDAEVVLKGTLGADGFTGRAERRHGEVSVEVRGEEERRGARRLSACRAPRVRAGQPTFRDSVPARSGARRARPDAPALRSRSASEPWPPSAPSRSLPRSSSPPTPRPPRSPAPAAGRAAWSTAASARSTSSPG